jgi:hypothetical protein
MMVRVDGVVLYTGCGWGRICATIEQNISIELGFNFIASYFVLYFVHVGFVHGVRLYYCKFFLSNHNCNFDIHNLHAYMLFLKN